MRFSVVVCTYNRAKYLAQTLNSVAAQDFPKNRFELVIVDNNSPDDTAQVSQAFAEQHAELTVRYFKEVQQGISYGRNRGVTEARGEFIAFIDDDETIDPDYLSNLDAFFSQFNDASLCGGPVVPVYETKRPKWLSKFTMRLVTGAYYKGAKIKPVGEKDYPGTGHATFRRSLFLEYGGFNTELGRKGNSLMGAEDKDFFLRLMQNGVLCYYLPTAVIYHHIPDAKLTNDYFNRLTYAIGVSERKRTLALSKGSFYKRLFSEGVKWAASFVLFFFYLITFRPSKGVKLIVFRWNVTKGLLGK